MIKKNFYINLFAILTIVSVFILSLILGPYYINGDQVHYYRLYNGIAGSSITDGYSFYKNNIDSREPIYFLIIWIASNLGINKVSLIAFFNVITSFYVFRFLIKIGGHPTISYLIVSFSYFSYVIFFSAERLKFSLLFLFIGIFYINSHKKIGYFFLALSPITHIQAAILYSSFFVSSIKDDILYLFSDFKITKKFLVFLITTILAVVLFYFLMQEQIISKINSYLRFRGLLEIWKLVGLFFLASLYSKEKLNVILSFLPLFIFALILGQDRINIFGYFLFLYFAIPYKQGFNIGVLLTTSYFVYTGFDFISKVLNYGDGFYSI